MKTFLPSALLAGAAALVLVQVAAKPSFVVRIPNGGNVPGVLAVGHLDPMGSNKSMNSFGRAFKSNRQWWNATLCVKDSDGDGQTNGQELGDPCCLWTNVTNPFPAFIEGISDPGDNKSMVDPALLAKYLPCPADSPAVIYAIPPTPATTAPTPATTAPTPDTTAPTPDTTAPTPATTAPTPATTAPTPATTAPTPATTAPTPATTAPTPTTTAPTPATTAPTPATTAPTPATTAPTPSITVPPATTRKPELCLPASATPHQSTKGKPTPMKTKKKWTKGSSMTSAPATTAPVNKDSDDSSSE